MAKNTIKYHYFNNWFRKRGTKKLTLEEAQKRFEEGKVFYILVGDEEKPSYIITNLGDDVITIQILNDNLDCILKLDYEIMENLDREKLFLCRYTIDTWKEDERVLCKVVAWSVIKDYNGGDALYEILKHPRYEELDLLTDIEEVGEIDVPVDESLHWRDYPKFGEWNFMVEDSITFKESINV